MTHHSSKPLLCILLTGLAVLLLTSCKPSVPREYIQPREMEDILFDYHLAMATAANEYQYGDDIRRLQAQYRKKVYARHGITQAQFDESMTYYYRHADRLNQIYKNLQERFSAEGAKLGVSIAQGGSNQTLAGDTANVWKGKPSFLLLPYKPHNIYSFYQKADTAFHPGDQLALHYDVTSIYQDGPRDATMYLVVRYKNDSIATQMRRINNTAHYTLMIPDPHKTGIKEIRGYFVMPHSLADIGSNSYRAIYVYGMCLVRMQPTDKPDEENNIQHSDGVNPSREVPGDMLQAEEGMGEQLITDEIPGVDRSRPHRAQGEHQWNINNPNRQHNNIQKQKAPTPPPPPGNLPRPSTQVKQGRPGYEKQTVPAEEKAQNQAL